MEYTLAITFNDFPKIIHITPYVHQGVSIVEPKLIFQHPRTGKNTPVYFRGVSRIGKNIYYYSEGNRAGEALGG